MPKAIGDMHVGNHYHTRNGLIEILEIIDLTNIRIKFLEHHYETIVKSSSIRNGEIKNYMKPSVCNIGFLGDGVYPSKINNKITPVYQVWKSMLNRVYKPGTQKLARQYAGTSIHIYWHNFQNFAAWYHDQIDHFNSVDFRWEIDKDLLFPCNKIYSSMTCCVIPNAINSLLLDRADSRGDLPIGITRNRKGYQVRVNSSGVRKSIGYYKTIPEAQIAYWSAKFEIIRDTTIKYWPYIPESLAFRLLCFGWKEAVEYYGDDATIWSD